MIYTFNLNYYFYSQQKEKLLRRRFGQLFQMCVLDLGYNTLRSQFISPYCRQCQGQTQNKTQLLYSWFHFCIVFHGFVCRAFGSVLQCAQCDPAQGHLDFSGRANRGWVTIQVASTNFFFFLIFFLYFAYGKYKGILILFYQDMQEHPGS